MEEVPQVLILGIGNLLWADEGFGVRAVEALNRTHAFGANVTLMDGGTQGLYLIDHIRRTDILVVFDAVDYGLSAGTLKLVEDGEVPKFLGARKMSLHQTGFQEVLAAADLFGDLPRRILLVGVQPEELEDYGGSLRDRVKARIGEAAKAALDWLSRLGVEATARDVPLLENVTLSSPEVALAAYEEKRPSAAAAYRCGDARVVFSAPHVPGSDEPSEAIAGERR